MVTSLTLHDEAVSSLDDRIDSVRRRIADAAARVGRDPESITLLAAGKSVATTTLLAAYLEGIRAFGESYVQEAIAKWSEIRSQMPESQLHLIGRLQTNKAAAAVNLFDLIESVDSVRLGLAVAKRAVRAGRTVGVLLEVKLDSSQAKIGLSAGEVLAAQAALAQVPGIQVRGLMGIAPYGGNPELSRSAFKQLAQLFGKLPAECRGILSMGMSGDFEVAIEEGATEIRIGTALFGSRTPRFH
ncbi:MAG TPA: YggS family pyridoxal phosphate-dependent enzyme [Chthonomonadales bacterium]|nr:YggS family pyridoxal phosphate-dependent enzyme [Chthonomonadales bacterium]